MKSKNLYKQFLFRSNFLLKLSIICSSFKWHNYIQTMFKEGLNIKTPLLNFGVSINQNETDQHILALDHPSFWPATRNMLLFSSKKFHKVNFTRDLKNMIFLSLDRLIGFVLL